jgi:predicted DNA-binding transcriptional regulator YafY
MPSRYKVPSKRKVASLRVRETVKKTLKKKGRVLTTRPPLARMRRIFDYIKTGAYPGRERLATEIEVTTKTIQRDIDFMRDQMMTPIDYSREHKGYYLTEDIESLPFFHLSEHELVSLLVAEKALGQYKGTPFEIPLKSAFEKLSDELDGKISLNWADLDKLISFRGPEAEPADPDVFTKMTRAVRDQLEVGFKYKKLGSRRWEHREVRPYHVACIDGQWYCFAYDLARKDIRTFVLPRIQPDSVEVSQKTFQMPASFDLDDYLRSSFGVFKGSEAHRVVVKLDAWAGRLARERRWHPSQQIRDLPGPDGEIEIEFQLGSFEEIIPWILSWGSHAQVLKPKKLVDEIRKEADAILENHH